MQRLPRSANPRCRAAAAEAIEPPGAGPDTQTSRAEFATRSSSMTCTSAAIDPIRNSHLTHELVRKIHRPRSRSAEGRERESIGKSFDRAERQALLASAINYATRRTATLCRLCHAHENICVFGRRTDLLSRIEFQPPKRCPECRELSDRTRNGSMRMGIRRATCGRGITSDFTSRPSGHALDALVLALVAFCSTPSRVAHRCP
jgi:hypothetical protein